MTRISITKYKEYLKTIKTAYYLLYRYDPSIYTPVDNHVILQVARSNLIENLRLHHWRNDPDLEVSAPITYPDFVFLRRQPEYMTALDFARCNNRQIRVATIIEWYFKPHPPQADTPRQSHST